MRTTITFADDTAAAVEHLRVERGIGVSEAVNELVRRGLTAPAERKPFRTRTYDMGLKVDITCVSRALEEIEGPAYR